MRRGGRRIGEEVARPQGVGVATERKPRGVDFFLYKEEKTGKTGASKAHMRPELSVISQEVASSTEATFSLLVPSFFSFFSISPRPLSKKKKMATTKSRGPTTKTAAEWGGRRKN